MISEFVPNVRESFRTIAGSPDVTGSLTYEPSGRSTVVTQRLALQTVERFFALPNAVVAGSLRRNMAAGLAEAKDLLERQAAGSG